MNTDKTDINKYPKKNSDINVEDYHNLVLKVFGHMIKKFGPWVARHKSDLIQTGYIGLLKAKEKYTPGRGSFLGLAYLRIMSAMQNEIAKYAKFEMNTTPLETLKLVSNADNKENLDWSDMFSADILDYGTIFNFIEEEDDKKVLYGIINMYPYWKLRNILKETKEEHDSRVSKIRQELRELVEILHPNS